MATEITSELSSFHQFVGEQLEDGQTQLSPEQALVLWRERFDTIESIRRGLTDIDCGRTKSRDEFVKDFEKRHNISDDS